VPVTATKTWIFANLVLRKTIAGGVTPVAGGDPFNYTITVTNEGSLATTEDATVTDTLGPGLAFAGTATVADNAGTCAPPSGSALACTITQRMAPGATVTITVPARIIAGTTGQVRNLATVDSPEDPLCPNGECPPPPECPEPVTAGAQPIAVLAETVTANPNDNQACVLSAVFEPPVVPPTTVADQPLPRTGSDSWPALVGGVFLLTGFGLVVVARRRRPGSHVRSG